MRRGDAKVVIQILKKTNELLKVVTQPVYSKHILNSKCNACKVENIVAWKNVKNGKYIAWKITSSVTISSR